MDHVQNLDDVLMTLKTLNQLENQAIAIWYGNVEGLQKVIKEVQKNFMRPESLEEKRTGARVPKPSERKKSEAMSELEGSIKKLQEELSKMG